MDTTYVNYLYKLQTQIELDSFKEILMRGSSIMDVSQYLHEGKGPTITYVYTFGGGE